jgi:hypothetical protein
VSLSLSFFFSRRSKVLLERRRVPLGPRVRLADVSPSECDLQLEKVKERSGLYVSNKAMLIRALPPKEGK